MEGLLAAFPKLVGLGQQHTFVETDSVRYVYQPLEELFVVLITTKTSNILEDLQTLHLFTRLVRGPLSPCPSCARVSRAPSPPCPPSLAHRSPSTAACPTRRRCRRTPTSSSLPLTSSSPWGTTTTCPFLRCDPRCAHTHARGARRDPHPAPGPSFLRVQVRTFTEMDSHEERIQEMIARVRVRTRRHTPRVLPRA